MPLDCTACGTCCFSRLKSYVTVTGADYERLGEQAEVYADFDGNRAFMRMVSGRCAALRIVDERFVCAVYAKRPETCRSLLPDSPQCAGEILTKGERPLIALRLKAGLS